MSKSLRELIAPRTNKTLAQQIDEFWSVYCEENTLEEDRKNALNFLIYALDVPDDAIEKINDYLKSLMEKREEHKSKNPEYVPGHAPRYLKLEPKELTIPATFEYGVFQNKKLDELARKREILDVHDRAKAADEEGTTFLDTIGRAKHRVIIRQRKFYKDGILFDTADYIAHFKEGWAGYTLNANGELSIFKHLNGKDNIFHSSMNSGAPVISAGELKITKGNLVAINTHSGHYRPTLFNVCRMLDYVSEHKVDISETKVYTRKNPKNQLTISSKEVVMQVGRKNVIYYETNALDLRNGLLNILNINIQSMKRYCFKYQKHPLTSFFALLDKMNPFSDNITKQKIKITKNLVIELNRIQASIMECKTTTQLKQEITNLNTFLEVIHHNVDMLSLGRLNIKINTFKNALKDVLTVSEKENPSENIADNEALQYFKNLM